MLGFLKRIRRSLIEEGLLKRRLSGWLVANTLVLIPVSDAAYSNHIIVAGLVFGADFLSGSANKIAPSKIEVYLEAEK